MTNELATGWGPSTPPDDTLARAAVENVADRIALMAAANNREFVRDHRWAAASLSDVGTFSSAGVVTSPQQDWSWLAQALADLAPDGAPSLAMSPFPTPDLTADGLVLIGHPPFMVMPPGGRKPRSVKGLMIEEVTDAASLATFERTLVDAFPVPDMDPVKAPLFQPRYLDGASRAYLAFLDDEPVATAAAHVAAGANQVEFVATLPKARGQGIGAAITWAASVTEPSLPAVLCASDDGRPVYESLGYLPVNRWTFWLRP